jgi:protein phosphatase 1 regulatory subunit 7
MLNALRIVNLANNQISKIENLDYLQNLTELNLKLNTIGAIENMRHLIKLEKLYLANNRIEIKSFDQCDLTRLTMMKELTLENNPCCKNKN